VNINKNMAQVKNEEDIILFIKEFRLYIGPLIEKTFNRDKCTARDRLCAVEHELSVLDLYLVDSNILLCMSTMKKLKETVLALNQIRLISVDEKQTIKKYATDLNKIMVDYLLQECDKHLALQRDI